MVLVLLGRLAERFAPKQNRFGGPIQLLRRTFHGVIFLGAGVASLSLIRRYVYAVELAEGPSMYATIPDSLILLGINKRYKKGHGIKVGDCVQITSPIIHGMYTNKRVIGLPGDYVLRSKPYSPTPGSAPVPGITDWRKGLEAEQVIKERGHSAEAVKQTIEEMDLEAEPEWDEPEMIQVPEGHVWVEGDNSSWSRDSRYFGPVPMALIKGRSTWFSDSFFRFSALGGLRKVEDDELDAVLGNEHG